MLTKERIKEAESNVRSYLSEGLIKQVSPNQKIIDLFLKNSKESLIVAEEISQKNISDLWVIVCSYYSMFYVANAVLYKIGYKLGEKIVHKVTSDALIVYVRKKLRESFIEEYENVRDEALNFAGIRADSLVESFELEKNKRSFIQYKTEEIEKHSKAKTSLERAKLFVKEMEKLLIE